jgi:short-subunit dehydrogenase
LHKNYAKVSKKNIIITGVSSGIGKECALRLSKEKYNVIATVRNQEDKEKLIKKSANIKVVLLDLNDSKSVKTASDKILKITQNNIFAIFHNAAYGQMGAVLDLSCETLQKQFNVNVSSTIEFNNFLMPAMLSKNKGRIIFNSSVLGFVAMRYRGAYNASKFALEGLADTLRLELANTNIKVILIEPGPIISKFRINAYRHFQENINYKNSKYKKAYDRLKKNLLKKGAVAPFTLTPTSVYKKLIKALEAKNPKSRYFVTFPTYLFYWLKKILPIKMLDKILIKAA